MNFVFVHIPKNAGTSIHHGLRSSKIPFTYYGHSTMSEILKINPKPDFSFTIVRNPWDRQVSLYSYICKDTAHRLNRVVRECGSFENYIFQILLKEKDLYITQKEFLCSQDGSLLVDCIGRFENLEEDFSMICKKIKVKIILLRTMVTPHNHYITYYNDRTERMVADLFREDIDLFNYTFGRELT